MWKGVFWDDDYATYKSWGSGDIVKFVQCSFLSSSLRTMWTQAFSPFANAAANLVFIPAECVGESSNKRLLELPDKSGEDTESIKN